MKKIFIRKSIQGWLSLACCTAIMFACSPEEKETIIPEPTPESFQPKHADDVEYKTSKDGKIVLGKKLQNPYTIQVMQQAFTNIIKKANARISVNESPVEVTHYYLRFLPKDWKEYETLKADTALKLYDVPLDYEVKLHGNTYHDPSIPESSPTWQYTVIEKNYQLNSRIKHEILEELYLPEKDVNLVKVASTERVAGKTFLDALVDEAMKLTQNYSDTLKVNSATVRLRTNWNPSGVVRVYDTRLGRLIPLVGIKMRARRWFDIREVYTDQNGAYRISSFARDVNYALYWETDDFDVRTGTFGQAWIDGPKTDNPWNVDLWDGNNRYYSHVFRGARRYHNGEVGGIKRPNIWTKIKYCAYEGNKDGVNGDCWGNWDPTGVTPDIRMWRFVNGRERDSDEIFSTAVHETAHASHIQIMNAGTIQFLQVSNIIVESWAVAIQWQITAMEYRERGIPDFADPFFFNTNIQRLKYSYQYWSKNVGTDYTSLFIDLIDNHNQAGRFFPSVTDNVSGYTLGGIETSFLKHVYGLSSLRDELKANKPSGVTNAQIDELMNNF